MQRITTPLLLALILVLATWAASPTPAAHAEAPAPPFEYLNGYLIDTPFLSFFTAKGGVTSFGNPVTDAFIDEGGLTVQYFEFARMEWRDDHVELSHLGRLAAEGHSTTAAFAWVDSSVSLAEGRTYVPESGHTLGGAFSWYWQSNGGVGLLGFPISEEFAEAQSDGTSSLTQYFERVVLVYHPATATAADSVQRVTLGVKFAPERPATPPPSILASTRITYRPGTGDARNIANALGKLNGLRLNPGERLSFLRAVGPISEKNGYVPGSAIESGKIVYDSIGGGVCTASTLVYRLAWLAGLPIDTRSPHSFYLRSYADMPGLEAAVYDPGVDLVIRNNYPLPVIIQAQVEAGGATLSLWGFSDGRTVTLEGTEIRAESRRSANAEASSPMKPQWAAPAAADLQRDGVEVVNVRVIKLSGKNNQRERIVTYYAPMPLAERGEGSDESVGDGGR
jgi:hypothetical protein